MTEIEHSRGKQGVAELPPLVNNGHVPGARGAVFCKRFHARHLGLSCPIEFSSESPSVCVGARWVIAGQFYLAHDVCTGSQPVPGLWEISRVAEYFLILLHALLGPRHVVLRLRAVGIRSVAGGVRSGVRQPFECFWIPCLGWLTFRSLWGRSYWEHAPNFSGGCKSQARRPRGFQLRPFERGTRQHR